MLCDGGSSGRSSGRSNSRNSGRSSDSDRSNSGCGALGRGALSKGGLVCTRVCGKGCAEGLGIEQARDEGRVRRIDGPEGVDEKGHEHLARHLSRRVSKEGDIGAFVDAHVTKGLEAARLLLGPRGSLPLMPRGDGGDGAGEARAHRRADTLNQRDGCHVAQFVEGRHVNIEQKAEGREGKERRWRCDVF